MMCWGNHFLTIRMSSCGVASAECSQAGMESNAADRCLCRLVRHEALGTKKIRRREEAEKEFERRAAKFGLDEKWARVKALPVGPEKDALAEEIVEWLFR